MGETSGILSSGVSNLALQCDGVNLNDLKCVAVPHYVKMNNVLILGMDFVTSNKLKINTK